MKHLLCEPVELTEAELDAVAGGNPFEIVATLTAAGIASSVHATITSSFANAPASAVTSTVDNAVDISGP
jgi:hypothetical protein